MSTEQGTALDRGARIGARAVLGAFVVLLCLSNIHWIRCNTAPPRMYDDSAYLIEGVDLYRLLEDGQLSTFLGECTTASREAHPPMMKLLPVPASFVFGPGVGAALYTYTVFIPVFCLYLFLLARSLLGREDAAVMAVIFACLFPLTFGLWRNAMAEFGTAVAVVLALYHLRASAGYRVRLHLIALGLSLGWGLLWKISFPLFVVGPLVLVGMERLRALRAGEWKELVRSLVTVLAVAVVVAGPFYLRSFDTVWAKLQSSVEDTQYNQLWGLGPVFSAHTVIRYWLLVVNSGVSSYFAALFALFLVIQVAVRRHPMPGIAFLGAWFLPPFAVLSFSVYKEARFLLPALPALAIFGAAALVGALATARRAARVAACGVAMLYPIYQYAAYSFDSRCLPRPDIRWGSFIVSISDLQGESVKWMPSYAFPATPTLWPTEETVALLAGREGKSVAEASVGVPDGHPFFNATVLTYQSRLRGARLRFQEALSRTQYLVTLTSSPAKYGPLDVRDAFLHRVLDDRRLPFREIARIPLKEPGEVVIYERVAGPGNAVRPWRNLPEEFEGCGASFYDGVRRTFARDGSAVPVIVPRAGTAIRFPYVQVPESGAVLRLSFGLDDQGDTARCVHTVEVSATEHGGGPGQAVLRRTIASASDTRWYDDTVSLHPFAGGIIELTLAVATSSGTNAPCDAIGWGTIELSYPE